MDFHVVIDVSSLIWNIDEFKVNAAPYYDLANEWISFIEIFEKEEPAILLCN